MANSNFGFENHLPCALFATYLHIQTTTHTSHFYGIAHRQQINLITFGPNYIDWKYINNLLPLCIIFSRLTWVDVSEQSNATVTRFPEMALIVQRPAY